MLIKGPHRVPLLTEDQSIPQVGLTVINWRACERLLQKEGLFIGLVRGCAVTSSEDRLAKSQHAMFALRFHPISTLSSVQRQAPNLTCREAECAVWPAHCVN